MEINKQFSTKICHSQQQNIQNFKNIQTNTSHNHSCENFKNQNFVYSQQQVRLNIKKTKFINQVRNLSVKKQKYIQNQCSLQQGCVICVDNIISLNQRQKIQQQNDESRMNQQLIMSSDDNKQLRNNSFSGRLKILIKSTNYKIQDQNLVIKLTNCQQYFQSKDSIIQQKYLASSYNPNYQQRGCNQQQLNQQTHYIMQSVLNKSNNFTNSKKIKKIHFSGLNNQLNGDSQTNNKQPNKNIIQSLKMTCMPKCFIHLLQIINLSYVLPGVLQFDHDILNRVIKLLEQYSYQSQKSVMQEYENSLNQNKYNIIYFGEKLKLMLQDQLFKFIKNIVSLMIQEMTPQKLQLMEKSSSYNMVCLAKFTKQNQLFQFVFKYNWPLIVKQIVKISQEEFLLSEQSYQQNQVLAFKQQFFQSLHFLQNSIQRQNYNIPQNIEISLQIISLLIDSFSKTNLFRQFFNKKIQTNRITSKKKNQLQEEKKKLQHTLKKLNSQKNKKIKKITKNNKKVKNNQQKDQQSKDYGLMQKIQQIQKQVENIMILIEQQNNQQNLLSCCLYLGKDKNNFIYWYVNHFSSMIFVEKIKNSWFLLQFQQIPQFLESLDIKNYNEIKLYERVNQQYNKYLQRSQKCKMRMDLEQNSKQIPAEQIFISKIQNQLQICKRAQYEKNGKIQIQVDKIIKQNQLFDNEQSRSSLESHSSLVDGLFQFKIDKYSLYKMIQAGQSKMTEYLKDRNSKWGNEIAKEILLNTIKGQNSSWLQDVKKQLTIFNQKICVVEIQYKVYVQQSSQQVDSKIKKIQTKIWGINQKYKHNWYDFIGNCNNFSQLFYGVCILYSLIKKYTSKNRKLRKQYEQIRQKTTYLKTQTKKQWIKDSWNEQCQVCGLSGEVLCCDFCPKVYHLQCVNLLSIPSLQFKCKACIEQVTTRNQLKSLTENKKIKKR